MFFMINMKNQNMIGCWSGTVESLDGYTNCKIKNEKEIIIWQEKSKQKI